MQCLRYACVVGFKRGDYALKGHAEFKGSVICIITYKQRFCIHMYSYIFLLYLGGRNDTSDILYLYNSHRAMVICELN